MGRFLYEAVTSAGDIEKGTMEARSASDVIDRLLERRMTPLRTVPVGEWEGIQRIQNLFDRQGISFAELVSFTRQLATLLAAGIMLDRALTMIHRAMGGEKTKRILERLLANVRKGQSLSNALEQEGKVFPRYYVALVRAGEISGTLPLSLNRLADLLERSQHIRRKVKSALAYPTLVLVVMMLTLTLVFFYVVPAFEPMLEGARSALPLMTRLVMSTGRFVQGYWWAMMFGVLGAALGIIHLLRRPDVRAKIDTFLARSSFTSKLIMGWEVANIGRSLGVMLASRVPLADGLAIVANTSRNTFIRQHLQESVIEVRQGSGLSTALGRRRFLPPLALEFVAIGEQTGRLDEMLTKVGEIYDAELVANLERYINFLVPTLTVLMGILVAVVIASVLSGIVAANQFVF